MVVNLVNYVQILISMLHFRFDWCQLATRLMQGVFKPETLIAATMSGQPAKWSNGRIGGRVNI